VTVVAVASDSGRPSMVVSDSDEQRWWENRRWRATMVKNQRWLRFV